MLEFIAQNLPTIIIGAVVFGILAAVAVKIFRDHKNHKSSCACGCENCPSSGMCHHD
jgi:ABC-type Mn2+/Zn2+ transport system permease subunit